MRPSFKPVVTAVVFAILLIGSAYFLKGSAAKDWVQAGLYGIGFYLLYRYTASSTKCSTKKTGS